VHTGKEYTPSSLSLSYIKIGRGSKSAIAFHGFGQDSSHYACFESVLGKEYTLYSFDLPWHGMQNIEKTENPVDLNALRSFFLDFLELNNISQYTSIGFSIGAKMSLSLLNLFPEKTERLLLIAPDGFRTNIWYKLATGTRTTRSLFKYFTYNPDFFFRFSDTMVRLKLVHPGVSRFARSQMNSTTKREKVYYTWMFFRELRFNKKLILKTLVENEIPVSIFLGSEDKIIKADQFKFLSEAPQINCKIIILKAGHNNLIEETARYLEQAQ
jgi:pimeloyl-ACP methyl ester carboxylesterase